MNKDERIKELEDKAYSLMTAEEVFNTLEAVNPDEAEEYANLMGWNE